MDLQKSSSSGMCAKRTSLSWGHACGVGRILVAWQRSHSNGVITNCKKAWRNFLRGFQEQEV